MNPGRLRILRTTENPAGPVLYWMHRDFRTADNWGFVHALDEARRRQQSLAVVFCLTPRFLAATAFHFEFLLEGLQEIETDLDDLGVPLCALSGQPGEEVARFANQIRAGLVVTDFDPLRLKRSWLGTCMSRTSCALHEVDSRNVVPCLVASDKREYMARTLRPKIRRLLPEYLEEFPRLEPQPHVWSHTCPGPDFTYLHRQLAGLDAHRPQTVLRPGERGARALLTTFLDGQLHGYAARRDPNLDVTSRLSAYLHFGMISAQRIMLEIRDRRLNGTDVDEFVDELLVRRELAENFCQHTQDYDSVSAFPAWARQTLHKHRSDLRPTVYTQGQLRRAETHDPLWNAAQTQMVQSGYMHGYLRMYWAKKILQWSENEVNALATAIELNDRFSLDGRDPNGYAGIAWSIGGVHDRGWTERPIFGTVRYMNLAGARRKFDVDRFVQTWLPHTQQSS